MIPRLFIVDDEKPARTRLMALLSDIAEECPHQLVGEAGHAEGAIEGIKATRPDIVLLDIQMPGTSGLELAAQLSASMEEAPSVIFITAYDDYALKAFDVQAVDYLVKPVRAERLARAVQRAAALRQAARSSADGADGSGIAQAVRQHFSVQERGRMLLVPLADVIYLKAELKYVTLRTREEEYLIEESLTSIEDELSDIFVRVHRNALVARNAICGVEKGTAQVDGEKGQESWQVILRDVPERLPISRRQWPFVKSLVRGA